MTVKADQFRDAMARFATGVTVVAAWGEDGNPVGFTANAVCSVSLEPPLLLFCADRGSKSLGVLLETGRFSVSVLAAHDGELARRFADVERADRFRNLSLHDADGLPPLLPLALAWVQCRVWRSLEAGDHTVVIGEVVDCGSVEDGSPLVFFGGRFRTVADLPRPSDE